MNTDTTESKFGYFFWIQHKLQARWPPRKRKGSRDECDATHRLGTGMLGLVLHDPHTGSFFYASAKPDDQILRTFSPGKKTYIAQLEMLAAISAFFSYPELLRGRRVHMFIDNAVALSAMIHGYAKSTDMAYMSNAFHMQLAGLRASVYLDYVPSKANIADLPSRGEFRLLRRLGAAKVRMKTPTFTQWSVSLGEWSDRLEEP